MSENQKVLIVIRKNKIFPIFKCVLIFLSDEFLFQLKTHLKI